MNFADSLVLGYMIVLIVALIIFAMFAIRANKRLAEKNELLEKERDEAKLKLQILQQELKTICELLPTSEEAKEILGKLPDDSGRKFF